MYKFHNHKIHCLLQIIFVFLQIITNIFKILKVCNNSIFSPWLSIFLDENIANLWISKITLFLKLPNKNMEKLEIFKQVGRNIQQIRLSKGLSQVDLVGRIEGNIDTTNISRIEQGRTNPTLLTLYRIAQALEVHLTDLVANNMVKVVEK